MRSRERVAERASRDPSDGPDVDVRSGLFEQFSLGGFNEGFVRFDAALGCIKAVCERAMSWFSFEQSLVKFNDTVEEEPTHGTARRGLTASS